MGLVMSIKKRRGLGFRDLQYFNEAMLAKQGWRLVNDDTSLLTKTLKAIYFPNKCFLEATIGNNPSHTWRSIIAGRNIHARGLRWNIGDGKSVRAWHDLWIPYQPGFKVLSTNPGYTDDQQVADLMRDDAPRILPTKYALMKRGVDIDPHCSRYGLDIETPEHALRECPWAAFFLGDRDF
ncbi:hypothetical protein DH2020_004186 [Rehmannia glutinosa]|uniref:Uncharacterized protein n=1 Tax=Rehmannia glutinosa TaxID=99300 RepID=A0ABR0XP39_REHGL